MARLCTIECRNMCGTTRRGGRLYAAPHTPTFSPTLESIHAKQVDLMILGDLHLREDSMDDFCTARDQMKGILSDSASDSSDSLVVQLGDVGAGRISGSAEAFQLAKDYLQGFDCQFSTILGNHDMEGSEFTTDEENLTAWQECFMQHHCWVRDAGPAVLIGISSTRFRSNEYAHHEVHIDEHQLAWLRDTLTNVAPQKPVILFSHAPPMGCGLKVITSLHVKNRVAWLNHSNHPEQFVDMVAEFPRVRAWFSGHFHLSQNYADSIVALGSCAFIQTGVIGPKSSRDGDRQSRMLQLSEQGYKVYTVNHDSDGPPRLDLDVAWSDTSVPVPVTPDEEIVCDVEAGCICARDACSVLWWEGVQWWPTGQKTMLALQDNMLLEYDTNTFSPSGVVTLDVQGQEVRLTDWQGQDLTSNIPGTGEEVERIELLDPETKMTVRAYGRNVFGGFFQTFMLNKWRQRTAQGLVCTPR